MVSPTAIVSVLFSHYTLNCRKFPCVLQAETNLSLVGKILCLFVVSRPDICFAVYNLAQFLSNPGKAHWCALKHLLRFLKGNQSLSLVHNRSENLELWVFWIQIGPPTRRIWRWTFGSNEFARIFILSLRSK